LFELDRVTVITVDSSFGNKWI